MSNITNDNFSLNESGRDLKRQSESSDEDAMSENRNIAAEGDEKSDSSDARSITTDDAFLEDFEESYAKLLQIRAEDAPQPEVTPEQAAQIAARPRRVLNRAGATAPTASSSSGVHVLQPPAASQSPFPPPPQPQDKGKGTEVLFDVPAHERPLSAEDEKGVRALNFAQLSHLTERFRLQIEAESRPKFHTEVQEMQTSFDLKLAAETAKWEAEKERTKRRVDRAANEAIATTKGLKERLKKMEQDIQGSFSKGEKAAVDNHAARWKSMDEQLASKEKQLQKKLDQEQQRCESLVRDQIDALEAQVTAQAQQISVQAQKIAAQAQEITAQAEEIGKLTREATSYVDNFAKQLSDKDGEIKRVRDEAAALQQQQLAARGQNIAHLQNQLDVELRRGHQAMEAIVQEQTMHEQALAHANGESLRQLRLRLLREQRERSSAPINMSGLTERLSALQIQNRAPKPANSDRQVQKMLTKLQSAKEQLQKDLASEKATNETLQKSLAECKGSQQSQPIAEDCSARLQDLEARLTQQCSRRLKDQAKRMQEGFRKDAGELIAEKDAELTRATAEAAEEKRLSQKAIASLQKEMEICHIELERQQKAFQAAKWTIQCRGDREKEHYEEKQTLLEERRELFWSKRRLTAELGTMTANCRSWSTTAGIHKAELRRANGTIEAVRGELVKVTRAKQGAESELKRVDGRLAECEAFLKKEAEEIHELEEMVDARLEAWEKWGAAAPSPDSAMVKEEMDAILGVPRWKQILFWLLMGLFAGLILAFSAASATNREGRMWLEGVDEATRYAVVSPRAGDGPEWRDPFLYLSRGMYGV